MGIKKAAGIIILAVAMVMAGGSAYAQTAKQFALGVQASFHSFQDDEITLFYNRGDTEYDAATAFSINWTCFLTPEFSLEVSLGQLSTDMSVNVIGVKEGYGELTQMPLLLTGRYHFSIDEKLVPYVGMGIGYYMHDMETAVGSSDYFYGAPSGVEAFADDAWGYHITAGIEYFVSDNVTFGLDLKYVFLSTDIGFDGAGYDERDSTNLDCLVTSVGVKFYF
jgi:outer membrane protein W